MSVTTKNRILESAIRLFNDRGIANVRLQQIADESGISVGNLAYHYTNKEAIVAGVLDIIQDEFAAILGEYLVYPNLMDLDLQLSRLQQFFQQYRFFLLDIPEVIRAFPEKESRLQSYFKKFSTQLRYRLDFFVQKGLLKGEAYPGMFDTLSHNLWLQAIFFQHQQLLKGTAHLPVNFRDQVWEQLLPLLTPKGQEIYVLEVQTYPDGLPM